MAFWSCGFFLNVYWFFFVWTLWSWQSRFNVFHCKLIKFVFFISFYYDFSTFLFILKRVLVLCVTFLFTRPLNVATGGFRFHIERDSKLLGAVNFSFMRRRPAIASLRLLWKFHLFMVGNIQPEHGRRRRETYSDCGNLICGNFHNW